MRILWKKIDKICYIQKLKPIPCQVKTFNNLLLHPWWVSWDLKNLNKDNKCQKIIKKIAKFCQKMLEFMMAKS